MLRRDFLKRLALTTGGLLVADDVLELLVEPRRKIWPVGVDLRSGWIDNRYEFAATVDGMWDFWTIDPVVGPRYAASQASCRSPISSTGV